MSSVQFVTRAGCLLCAEALPMVEATASRRGHTFEVLDVDVEDRLAALRDRVPVVLRDGAVVLAGHFERRDVRRVLR